jgi:hypothetical protein
MANGVRKDNEEKHLIESLLTCIHFIGITHFKVKVNYFDNPMFEGNIDVDIWSDG